MEKKPTSKTQTLKNLLCALARDDAARSIEEIYSSFPAWSSQLEKLQIALVSLGASEGCDAFISEDGKFSFYSQGKLTRVNIMFNNKELGSPRPWAIAKALGYGGEGGLDETFQAAVDELEKTFFNMFGLDGVFTKDSSQTLIKLTTDLLAKWFSNSAFISHSKLLKVARMWGAFGEKVLLVSDKSGLSYRIIDLTGFEDPSRLTVTRLGAAKLLLDFENGFVLTCRLHTDSKTWRQKSKLPIKLSFELAESPKRKGITHDSHLFSEW
jgi:hypothetical protein